MGTAFITITIYFIKSIDFFLNIVFLNNISGGNGRIGINKKLRTEMYAEIGKIKREN